MNDDEEFSLGTHAKKNEPILIMRMIRVGNESCRIIVKYGFSLFKRDTVFFIIGLVSLTEAKCGISYSDTGTLFCNDFEMFEQCNRAQYLIDNYVEKIQVHLKSYILIETKSQNIWKSFIDANFIRQYCLPDTIPNLIDFNFYICQHCQLSYNDIERITDSFKIHPFFISHQWTNVKCLFDPIMSCQHLFSSFINTSQISDNLM